MRINAKFIKGNYEVRLDKYSNGRTALVLVNGMGEIVRASINLVDAHCDEGYVFIKSYSENAGLIDELVRHGVVRIIRQVPCGFANAYYCRVLV